jgi:hypothetical protein
MRSPVTRTVLCGILLLGCGGSPNKTTGGTGGEEPPDDTGGSGGGTATGGKGTGGATSTGGAIGTGGATGTGGSATGGGVDAGTAPDGGVESPGMPTYFPGMHPACPSCKNLFDGKTTMGWTSWGKTGGGIGPVMGTWDVQNAALHSTGTIRDVLATNGNYNNFRLIFSIKHMDGGHQPCIVIWGRNPPPNDAMGGIQIQAPHTNMWDYRPGQNKNIGGTKVGTVAINDAQWAQCEVLAKGTTGSFRMACCQQDATGDKPCKGVEILKFSVAGAGNNGPISLQAHNGGVHDMYKNIYVEENPTVDDLLTTK